MNYEKLSVADTNARHYFSVQINASGGKINFNVSSPHF